MKKMFLKLLPYLLVGAIVVEKVLMSGDGAWWWPMGL